MNHSEKMLWEALENARLMHERKVERVYRHIKRTEGIMSWLSALLPFVLLMALLVAVGLTFPRQEREVQLLDVFRQEVGHERCQALALP